MHGACTSVVGQKGSDQNLFSTMSFSLRCYWLRGRFGRAYFIQAEQENELSIHHQIPALHTFDCCKDPDINFNVAKTQISALSGDDRNSHSRPTKG